MGKTESNFRSMCKGLDIYIISVTFDAGVEAVEFEDRAREGLRPRRGDGREQPSTV